TALYSSVNSAPSKIAPVTVGSTCDYPELAVSLDYTRQLSLALMILSCELKQRVGRIKECLRRLRFEVNLSTFRTNDGAHSSDRYSNALAVELTRNRLAACLAAAL